MFRGAMDDALYEDALNPKERQKFEKHILEANPELAQEIIRKIESNSKVIKQLSMKFNELEANSHYLVSLESTLARMEHEIRAIIQSQELTLNELGYIKNQLGIGNKKRFLLKIRGFIVAILKKNNFVFMFALRIRSFLQR
jgi:hypothetical protein